MHCKCKTTRNHLVEHLLIALYVTSHEKIGLCTCNAPLYIILFIASCVQAIYINIYIYICISYNTGKARVPVL